jgi:hypothetical protein
VIAIFFKPRRKDVRIKESDNKAVKIRKICEIFGLHFLENLEGKGKRSSNKFMPKTLSEMAKKILLSHKVSKQQLNIAYAEYVWPKKIFRVESKCYN